MPPRLAILTPYIGRVTETFIRLHVQALLPDSTVVVATGSEVGDSRRWEANAPELFLAEWLRKPGPRLIRGGMALAGWPGSLANWKVTKFIRSHKVTHVLAEYMDESVNWIPTLQRLRVKWYVQAHGMDVSATLRYPGIRERYLSYNEAEGIFTRSTFHKQRLIQIGLSPEKIHVNPGGVDIPSSRSVPNNEEFRCLAVGRMVTKKAPIFLLEAVRQAIQRNPNIHLDYVGSGMLLPAVRQFISAFRMESNVKIHSNADDSALNSIREKASAFVQHSITDPDTGDEEGLPAALQEAMAFGMPVVSTIHAGIPEAVTDGVHGFLAPEGDVAAMADRILDLSMNRSLASSLGQAGREKASIEYSWQAERQRVLSVMGIDCSSATENLDLPPKVH